jgi:subtilisin family serine protease
VRTVLFALAVAASSTVGAVPVLGETEVQVPDAVVQQFAADKAEKVYLVVMAGDPVVTYEGDVTGLAATRPGNGKIDPDSPAVKAYQRHLTGSHDAALGAAGVSRQSKLYDYTISLNGFAAAMTGSQAAALEKQAGVLLVFEDEIRHPTTDVSPAVLGLDAVWDGGSGQLGEDVIVGVIDTGITPESPSFSDQADLSDASGKGNKAKNSDYGPPPAGWHGTCQAGENWSKDDCNNKLIGARYFGRSFGWQRAFLPGEFVSARDWDGHGTHTSSTAAGNAGVDTNLGATITGMAPRARVAMYKACWNSGLGGCSTGDLVAAIDQAVADGVDVINYSIGSAARSITGPDDIAFLFAADAGVFVATSNGNDGPDPDTTGSPSSSPWLISVAATSHRGPVGGTATLGDATVVTGVSVADPAGTGDLLLVDASDLGNELCLLGVEFTEDITGKAVLCWRGENARVDKSAAVAEAGGAGMILANVVGEASSIVADIHSVPSVHIDAAAGLVVEAYIDSEGAGATANIAGQQGGLNAVAGFSSRGSGAVPDVIKPDIAAPGVNVLAAAPPSTFYGTTEGGVAQFLSGTSMASPHVAGIGALITEAHPEWTPAMIKSALMTTADIGQTLDQTGLAAATPFDTGSGLVQPGSALDPGLVYDAGFFDYLAFLCGSTTAVGAGTCSFLEGLGFSFDPSDLNQPNIGVADLAGSQTVVRTVTNVGPAGTYEVAVDAPSGIDVLVSPTSLTLGAGASATYEVTFTTLESASLDTWTFGSLAWSDGTRAVTSQLGIRPVKLAAPFEVSGSGADGSVAYDVAFGYTGSFIVAGHGLEEAVETPGNVVDDPENDINAALGSGVGVTFHAVEVPAGTAVTRFSLFDDATDGADDLDLYVFGPESAGFPFVGGSGSPTSAERVDLIDPSPGLYLVVVHGWQTDGPDSNYALFSWDVSATPGNDLTVTGPAAATLGETGTVEASWSGLVAGSRYLGAVSYDDGGGIFQMTLVSVLAE